MSARALYPARGLSGEWWLLDCASFETLDLFLKLLAGESGGVAEELDFIVLLICFFSFAGAIFALVSFDPCFLFVGMFGNG